MSIWTKHSQQWQKIGPPLRPQAEDLAFLSDTVLASSDFSRNDLNILLLGVTPEITALPWSTGSRLLAVDVSRPMIQQVWTPNSTIWANAVQGNWFKLPADDESFDLIVGDCCMTMMHPEQDMPRFLEEVQRVLRPEGILAMRLFVRPESGETPEHVFGDLWNKRIGNFNIFKWRLLMALHGSLHEGVMISRAWDCWQQSVSDISEIVACTGWDPAILATIGAYQDSPSRYFFPTLQEFRAILKRFLTEMSIKTPAYELGCCCPTVIYSSP